MKTNKNRKSFMAVIQVDVKNKNKKPKPSARVYRIKKNKPVLLGHVYFPRMFYSRDERDMAIVSYLVYNGHVLACHSRGVDFNLSVV